jgi:hypothetical protein
MVRRGGGGSLLYNERAMTNSSKVRPSRDHVVSPHMANPAAPYARRAARSSRTTVESQLITPSLDRPRGTGIAQEGGAATATRFR